MASEYFSTLQYIWLNIVFFVFSLFLFAVCLYACLFVRWVYKRRLRQKTDEMIDAYKGEETKRKEIELNLKRQELEFPPEKKRKSSSKHRNIHIVTKPCNHIIQKNSRELIVRQVNETPNDEVACELVGQPPVQQQQQMNQMAPVVNPQQIHRMDQFQQQYVLVPVEVLRNPVKVRRSRSTAQNAEKLIVESVATQTSDRSDEEPQVEKRSSEDWLTKFDEKDGERIDVDEEFEEQDSERYMRRHREIDPKLYPKKDHHHHPEVPSDEVRVSIENDSPPSPPKNDSAETSSNPTTSSDSTPSTTSSTGSKTTTRDGTDDLSNLVAKSPKKSNPKGSGAPKQGSPEKTEKASGSPRSKNPKESNQGAPGSDSAGPNAQNSVLPSTASVDPDGSNDPKKSDKDKQAPLGDKSYVASQYFGQPGENVSALSSNNNTPPPKSTSPAVRPSIFPYFVDPKAPSTSVSTSKASSKLTEPELEVTDSSCALYRKKKKMPSDSAKIYNGTPKAKTPK